MSLSPSAAPAAANPDLVAVHRALVGVVQRLDTSIGQAPDAARVTAILDEIAEVNARVTAVGRQLFTQQTDGIARLAAEVGDAIPAVEGAIERLEGVKELVQSVTSFLRVVDKLVDTAKLVA